MRPQARVIFSDQLVSLVPLAAVIVIGTYLGGALVRFLVQVGRIDPGSSTYLINDTAVAVSYLALCDVVVGLWRFAKPPGRRSTAVAVVGVAGAMLIVVTLVVDATTALDTTLFLRIGQVAVGLWMIDINIELKDRQLFGSSGTNYGIAVGVAQVVVVIALWSGFTFVLRWVGLLAGLGYLLWLGWIAVRLTQATRAARGNSC